jgi:eukaryotic translation initiation factor 2C
MPLPIICPPPQKLIETCSVEKWAVVNFSARCDVGRLIHDLIKNASAKGIVCFSLSHILYNFLLLALYFCSKWTSLLICLKRAPL